MPINQRNAGFISATYQPLQVANAPTIGAATAGDTTASVAFTAPANVGGSAISAYYAVSNPDRVTVSGASSPITVTGLTNGTAYTFSVWALNTYGPSPFSGASGSVTPAAPRGLFAGGFTPSASNVIQYVTISTTGNAIDFGDLTVTRTQFPAGASSSSRGLFAGGTDGSGGSARSSIDYVTIPSTGNAANFGNLSGNRYNLAACSNSTRGVFSGGTDENATQFQNMQYVTIASTGNTTFFGDLIEVNYAFMGSGSPTRGVFAGGYPSNSFTNIIQYITIASTGNATDFGDLTTARYNSSSSSSSTRAIFAGGGSAGGTLSNINYITIATTGNASTFGNLVAATEVSASTGSSTRGLIAGGSVSNVIQYITFATEGNGTDFGDLLSNTTQLTACSNAHGGL